MSLARLRVPVLLAALLWSSTALADSVKVKNQTGRTTYAAFYLVKGKSSDGKHDRVHRSGSVVAIAPGASVELPRPDRATYREGLHLPRLYDRDVYFADSAAALGDTIEKGTLSWVNVGSSHADVVLQGLGAGGVSASLGSGVENITVHNETSRALGAAIYFVTGESDDGKGGTVDRVGTAVTILAHGSAQIERPAAKCQPGKSVGPVCTHHLDRDLYFAGDATALGASIAKASQAWVNVGDAKGTVFHLAESSGRLEGYDEAAWVVRPVVNELDVLERVRAAYRKKYGDHAWSQKRANVRTTNALGAEEQAYL